MSRNDRQVEKAISVGANNLKYRKYYGDGYGNQIYTLRNEQFHYKFQQAS